MDVATNGPLLVVWLLYLALLVWIGFRVHSRWNEDD
jgi:hypothetical protein